MSLFCFKLLNLLLFVTEATEKSSCAHEFIGKHSVLGSEMQGRDKVRQWHCIVIGTV